MMLLVIVLMILALAILIGHAIYMASDDREPPDRKPTNLGDDWP